jgi:hypothetical protein
MGKGFSDMGIRKKPGRDAFTDIGCIKLKPDLHHRFEA